MAKPVAITADDLRPTTAPPSKTATRQRGVVPSAELVPLQFRMPEEFVQAFKQEALDRKMKLNAFLNYLFHENKKKTKS